MNKLPPETACGIGPRPQTAVALWSAQGDVALGFQCCDMETGWARDAGGDVIQKYRDEVGEGVFAAHPQPVLKTQAPWSTPLPAPSPQNSSSLELNYTLTHFVFKKHVYFWSDSL